MSRVEFHHVALHGKGAGSNKREDFPGFGHRSSQRLFQQKVLARRQNLPGVFEVTMDRCGNIDSVDMSEHHSEVVVSPCRTELLGKCGRALHRATADRGQRGVLADAECWHGSPPGNPAGSHYAVFDPTHFRLLLYSSLAS